jgi:hypothetical protein
MNRSGRPGKLCQLCRDKHRKTVALVKTTTSLSAAEMSKLVVCEGCGQMISLREMNAHLKTHNHNLFDIPGIRPAGEFADV